MRVKFVKEFGFRRREAVAHVGEFVVDEAGIQTGYEAAGHGCDENEDEEAGDGFAEYGELGGGELREDCEAFPWFLDESVLAQDGEAVPEHGGVADECCTEVCCEAVLGDSRVCAGSEQIILQSGLDHPPADEALEADQGGYSEQTDGHGRGDFAAGDEVDGGDGKRQADETPPLSVRPFHKINFLELVDVHVRVELFEFGRGPVAVEFSLPGLGAGGPDGSGDWLPFCDAQTVYC